MQGITSQAAKVRAVGALILMLVSNTSYGCRSVVLFVLMLGYTEVGALFTV